MLAWILRGRDTYRRRRQGVTLSKDFVRTAVRLGVAHADLVHLMHDGRSDDTFEERGADVAVAIARLSPAFQYDHMKILSENDRDQYRHWLSQGVASNDIWFFDLHDVTKVPIGVTTSLLCGDRRSVSKTFRLVNEDGVDDVVEDLVAQGWSEQDAASVLEIRMAICLPDLFAEMLAEGAFDRLAVPSPKASGVFKVPVWLQSMFDPDLLHCFESSVEPRGLDHPMREPFKMTDASDLAMYLRCVLFGTMGQDSMIAWVVKLQHFADSLKQVGATPGEPTWLCCEDTDVAPQ